MRVLMVANQKGGVGKTTTAVNLGDLLVRCGKRVLVVDLDAQGNVADSLGLEKGPGLEGLLFGCDVRPVSPSGREGLDVVLGDHSTMAARERLTGMMFRERVLGKRLRELVGYDVMILDSAPGVDLLQVSGMVACTDLLVPLELSSLAIGGAGDLVGSVQSLRELGGFSGRLLGFLPTKWDQATSESVGLLAGLRKRYGRLVWPPIPVDTRVRAAARLGRTLWEHDPKCRALRGAVVRNGDEADTVRLAGGYVAVLKRLLRTWQAEERDGKAD